MTNDNEARVQGALTIIRAFSHAAVSWDEVEESVRSLAAQQGEAVAWQPIETAPQQDDHSFLVRRNPRGNWTYVMQVSRFEGNMYPDHLDCNVDFDDRVTDATHWMPLTEVRSLVVKDAP